MHPHIDNSIAAIRSYRRRPQIEALNRHRAKIRSTFFIVACSAVLSTGVIVVMQRTLNAPVTGENGSSAREDLMRESKADDRWEPIYFEEINKRARLAKLPDLKTVTLGHNDLAVRVWIGFGVTPLEGIVLRRTNGTWMATYLASTAAGGNTRDLERVLPRAKSGWDNLWKQLTDGGILTLPDSSELPNEVMGRDGESFVVETKTGDHYRTYHYDSPRLQKWDEARRMLRIVEILSSEFNLKRSNLIDTGINDDEDLRKQRLSMEKELREASENIGLADLSDSRDMQGEIRIWFGFNIIYPQCLQLTRTQNVNEATFLAPKGAGNMAELDSKGNVIYERNILGPPKSGWQKLYGFLEEQGIGAPMKLAPEREHLIDPDDALIVIEARSGVAYSMEFFHLGNEQTNAKTALGVCLRLESEFGIRLGCGDSVSTR